jgi:hypothetical protein
MRCLKLDVEIFGSKEQQENGSGENYILRGLLICTVHTEFSCFKIEKK